MIFKDYYKILGLENNKASVDEIKYAYREQAKKYHPDINANRDFSEERFKDINEAYRVLSNAPSRRKYDRTWNSHIGSKRKNEENKREEGSVLGNFFHMFFGGKQEEHETQKNRNKKNPIKGENIETEVEVSILEAFYGKDKKISLRTLDGKMKTFEVKIPAGIRNGEKIRLLGQGKKGENGGNNGDLFIKINITDDKKFVLRGTELYTDLYLTPWEAALGTKTTVETITDTVSLYVPQGIQSGERVRIPGKGYKDGKGGRGDLVAEVKIMVPRKLTGEEQKEFEKLSSISKFNPRSL